MLLLSVTFLCSVVVCALGNCPAYHCEPGQTCCLSSFGKFECCRLPNATCCSDGKRCCPEGMECGKHDCIMKRTAQSISTLEKRQLSTEPAPEEDSTDSVTTTTEGYAARLNLCNRRSYCPHTYTCCIEPSGGYNCCPPNSICCPNSGHCCPEGTLCDLVLGTCRPGNTPFSKRHGLLELITNEVNINRCDKRFYCPDEHSCCMNRGDAYGCCPHENAVCCSDKRHCCQEGEVCHGALCVEGDYEMVMVASHIKETIPFVTEESNEFRYGSETE